jgi:hypothetical protein
MIVVALPCTEENVLVSIARKFSDLFEIRLFHVMSV